MFSMMYLLLMVAAFVGGFETIELLGSHSTVMVVVFVVRTGRGST